MSACRAELCPRWTGHGCICDVIGMDTDDPARSSDCTDECSEDCMADHRGEE